MSSQKAPVFKTIIKKQNILFTMVKYGQSYVPLCVIANFCAVGITAGFSNFLNVATLIYVVNYVICSYM